MAAETLEVEDAELLVSSLAISSVNDMVKLSRQPELRVAHALR